MTESFVVYNGDTRKFIVVKGRRRAADLFTAQFEKLTFEQKGIVREFVEGKTSRIGLVRWNFAGNFGYGDYISINNCEVES